MADHRASDSSIDLYWLPLGAGGRCVRWNGRLFEAVSARFAGRSSEELYHSALEVNDRGRRFVVKMAPVWNTDAPDRGVVLEGPVGSRWLGRFRFFRYEVRCWLNGWIPDVAEAVDGPRRLSSDPSQVARLLDMVTSVPSLTWGRDECRTGEMWNSNSLNSWLLARTGQEVEAIHPPDGGRAPGWHAGLVLASRQRATTLHDPALHSARPAVSLSRP